MPSLATAVDVARLYDELRDCVRANDQEGVKRVFNELVRARRPVAEILAEVKSISKERETSEPEGDVSPLREWPPRSTPSDAEHGTPPLRFRNFGPAIEPQPRPQPSDASGAAWRMSDPTPRSADRASARNFVPDASDSPPATEWEAEEDLPLPDEALQRADPFAVQPNPPDPIDRSTDPPIASEIPLQPFPPATATAASQPERDRISLEEAPAPSRLEDPTPDPRYQRFGEAISSDPAVAAATDAEPKRDDPLLDQAMQQSIAVALEQDAPDAAPQISSRAVSLGLELDRSPDAIKPAHPGRRVPGALLVVIAVVAIIAGVGGGWFLLMRPSGEQVAVAPASPGGGATTAGVSTGAAPAGQPAVATVANPAATGRNPEMAPAPAAPAPAPPAPAARPPVAAPSAPDDRSSPKPDAPPAVAKLETPKNTSPSVPASPDAPPPATAPTTAAPAATIPPSEPRASVAETAALLARGDALFGVGDVSSARLFYERAADAGDGQAALRLGETYDPTFLERAKLRAVQGDAAAAIFWYRRARELGVAEAEILLRGIQTK